MKNKFKHSFTNFSHKMGTIVFRKNNTFITALIIFTAALVCLLNTLEALVTTLTALVTILTALVVLPCNIYNSRIYFLKKVVLDQYIIVSIFTHIGQYHYQQFSNGWLFNLSNIGQNPKQINIGIY